MAMASLRIYGSLVYPLLALAFVGHFAWGKHSGVTRHYKFDVGYRSNYLLWLVVNINNLFILFLYIAFFGMNVKLRTG